MAIAEMKNRKRIISLVVLVLNITFDVERKTGNIV